MTGSGYNIGIGDLRSRLSLQAPVRISDGGGGAATSWTLVANLWAAVRPIHGKEKALADRISGSLTHEIHIRWRAGVAPSMRFVMGARVFEILVVMDNGERRQWLRCLCEERNL